MIKRTTEVRAFVRFNRLNSNRNVAMPSEPRILSGPGEVSHISNGAQWSLDRWKVPSKFRLFKS